MGGVRKRGKTWSYYYDIGIIDGKRKKKEKGGFNTKKEAEQALRSALIEFESCGSVKEQSDITVSDYMDYWYKEYVLLNCKHNTLSYYRRIIDNHIKPSLGEYKLKNINPAKLQEFLNIKYRNGFSKNSLKNFKGVLSKSLKMAVHPYQLITNNPMTYVNMPKFEEKVVTDDDLKIITIDEFNTIINRFSIGSTFYIPIQIAFHTGMRGGEVCALQWDCVDLENKTITIKQTLINKGKGIFELGTPKTKSSYRTIAIGDTLVNILKDHAKFQDENRDKYKKYYIKSDFVCTRENGEHVTTDTLKYLSRVINYELCIDFNFHSFRHTHATMLIEAGANIKDVQQRLGHSKLSTTMDTYAHVTSKMKFDTVNIFEDSLKKQFATS